MLKDKIQKIGVSAFIYKDGKALILRRSKKEKFMAGYYDMPGGKVEFGENLYKAVEREVKEEGNLKGKAIKPYATFSYISDNGNRHTTDVQFIIRVTSGKPKITNAHDDFVWVAEKDLKKYKLSKEMRNALIKGFKEIKLL
jgi:8-oxo-dGTP diphosphatase